MKKLLLVAAILAIGVTAFAGHSHDNGCKDKADATIDIYASICYPLLADGVKALRFGGIEAGTSEEISTHEPGAGIMMVQGQVGKDVKVEFNPKTYVWHVDGGAPAVAKMEVTQMLLREDPGTYLNSGDTFVLNDVNIFPFQRREYLKVGGKIQASETAGKKPGDYTGTFTVNFQYD